MQFQTPALFPAIYNHLYYCKAIKLRVQTIKLTFFYFYIALIIEAVLL